MILVTGGTGLVGSHLIWHLLQKGESVRAIHRKGSNLEGVKEVFGYYSEDSTYYRDEGSVSDNGLLSAGGLFEKIEWVQADMLDYSSLSELFDGVRKVYHCAAMVAFNPSDNRRMIKNNVESTANLVNLCLEHGIDKLCHVSSVSALGSRHDGTAVTETDLYRNSRKRHGYSVSKFYSEMEIWRGIAEGLNAVIVNPSIIIGPGNWNRGSAKFFTTVQKGLKYYTGGMTGFVDVRDVCRCMITLMESEKVNEKYILNGADLSYRDLFIMVARALNKPVPTRMASGWMLEAGWRAAWLLSRITLSKPLLTKATARSGNSISRYSNQKIKEATGHIFFPPEDTIEWTASFLKS